MKNMRTTDIKSKKPEGFYQKVEIELKRTIIGSIRLQSDPFILGTFEQLMILLHWGFLQFDDWWSIHGDIRSLTIEGIN